MPVRAAPRTAGAGADLPRRRARGRRGPLCRSAIARGRPRTRRGGGWCRSAGPPSHRDGAGGVRAWRSVVPLSLVGSENPFVDVVDQGGLGAVVVERAQLLACKPPLDRAIGVPVVVVLSQPLDEPDVARWLDGP